MGACWSVPIADPASSGSTPASKVAMVARDISSTETLTVASPMQSPSHHTSKDHGSESEECESNPEERQTHRGMYQTELGDEASISPVKTKTTPKELRVGYSSGGSSSNLEDDNGAPMKRNRTASCEHLVDLRNSIGVDRDICKGVVRIETDYGRRIEEIYDGVHDGPVLGSGVSGIVRRVKHRKTGVNYAVKCLDLGLINEKGQDALRQEVGVMCQLDHPNIVRLEEVYENETDIFLIQELCVGGDLFDRLDEQSNFHYSEWKCAKLVKQMLSAVRYLHSKNIIHRDLKLENFLFSTSDADSELKMIDFGLSKHFAHPGELQNEAVGTPYTVAPEMFHQKYDEKVDMWALGVITYLLLSGDTPFGGVDGESLLSVRAKILNGYVEFEKKDIWYHVSDEAKAFIKRLLEPDYSKRPTAKEAQRDNWLLTFGKNNAENGHSLSPGLCQALVEFKEYSDMRKFLCEVLSFTLLPEQICGLRLEFEKVDPEGEGEISLAILKQVLLESAEEGELGALTDTEVESIFNALRVKKTETKIRWHEFIAAGLSQCSFDERNLKLAFDRLDYDRKGFITLDDMKGLLGIMEEEDDEALLQMWQDGLDECCSPLGRITYDDFRMFVKGQKKERDPSSPLPKHSSKRFVLEGSQLQAVPEGTTSPQAKHKVFSKFDELSSSLDNLGLPLLGVPFLPFAPERIRKSEQVNIGFPVDLPVIPGHKRVRSRSLGEAPIVEVLDQFDEEERTIFKKSMTTPYVACPSKAIGELPHVIGRESKSGRVIRKALYRKHREYRRSVMVASKLFDLKQKARKLQLALEGSETTEATPQTNLEHFNPWDVGRTANLVMKRGSFQATDVKLEAESDHYTGKGAQDPLLPSVGVRRASETHQNGEVADAVRRSERPRRPRQRSTSDISGMVL